MNISEINSAKGLKIKLMHDSSSVDFQEDVLLNISSTQERCVLLVNQYGAGAHNMESTLCKVSLGTAEYLKDLLGAQNSGAFHCMFVVTGVESNHIEVQTYTFRTCKRYKTPITIMVSKELLQKRTIEQIKNEFVWNQLGEPALFCLNYKYDKKQKENIQFLGGKKIITASIKKNGIIAEKTDYLRKNYDMPIDIYIAPIIEFVPQDDSFYASGELLSDLEKITDSASYFARWNAYDELERKLIVKESEEFGEISYTSFSFVAEPTETEFVFELCDELDDSFLGKEVAATQKDENINDKDDGKRNEYSVGKIKKINGKKIVTRINTDDSVDVIPHEGVVRLQTAGDKYILARRKAARERMINHKSPIRSIVALIESGATDYEIPGGSKFNKGITEKLKRNFKKASDLNAEQIKAIEIAINTPDIALIQGPPGTGKTTVIKAICERFREIHENTEKELQRENPEYILQSPKILISSFQNEAVDNAISAPLQGEIPAYRKTAKRANDSSREQYQKSLENWYDELCKNVKCMIEDSVAAEYLEDKRMLDDQFLSYKNSGETLNDALELINRYLGYVEIPYPEELVSIAKSIIASAVDGVSGECVDPIIEKLESQRLTPETFEDDGLRNAKKLRAYLRINDELLISNDVVEVVEKVCKEGYSLEEFGAYVDAVEQLKEKYCKKEVTVDSSDREVVNECILSLSNAFSKHYMDTLSSLESKKSLILNEFLLKLGEDCESVVKKYSMTTAATCQTSLDLHNDVEQEYDLVIVDEAARANPLDLFIPMSMGKKVILVGDHKQLPHMLEPDVVKTMMDDHKFKYMPELEMSLFERLFNMFEKGNNPKSILLKHQYRMHPDICRFVSNVFYEGLLETANTVTPEDRMSSSEINKGKALAFINIPISRGAESRGASKSRQAEADILCEDVRHIINVEPKATIGVITFYAKQSQKINENLDSILNDEERRRVEVGTVDAFQGKEFDYVLLSCVRSNVPRKRGDKPNVGFLDKPNRLCVAFSRAKRQLAVYGDIETLIQIPCFEKLYDICSVKGGGCYREY